MRLSFICTSEPHVSSRHRRSRLLTVLVLALLAVPVLAQAATEDPYRPQQYGLDQIHASRAWSVSEGTGVVIAIIDSGVDLSHPDLVDRLDRDAAGHVIGRDFVGHDDDPQDENGHGTMVAGIAAATTGNGLGIASVAPSARIMPVRVLDSDGAGRSSDVDAGIRWAVDHGASVINLSLESVSPLPGSVVPQAPSSAVQYAWDHGAVVIAAAGNSGSPFTDYPASSPVLVVGATNRDGSRANFSDTGRTDAVMAPGVDIVSTWWCAPDDQRCGGQVHTYGEADGTSFAAPFVSGIAALLRASGDDNQQTVHRIRATAHDLGAAGRDAETGYGLVDAAAAVGLAEPAPSPTVSTRPSPTPSPSPSPSPSPDATTASASPGPTAAPTPTQRPSPPPPPPETTADADDQPPATTGTTPPATTQPTPTTAPPATTASPIGATATSAPLAGTRPAGAPTSGGHGWVRAFAALLVLATSGALVVASRDRRRNERA